MVRRAPDFSSRTDRRRPPGPTRVLRVACGRGVAAVVGAVLVATVVTLVPGAPAPAAAQEAAAAPEADAEVVTVMARNLYLGADVGVALELLPDLPAAAQFLWEQVAATDFDARVELLAAEAARERPAVIGLQEATRWRCRPGNLSRAVDVFDFTATFLDATRVAGEPYVIATVDGDRAEQPGYRIPGAAVAVPGRGPRHLPAAVRGATPRPAGSTLADALLVREDLADRVVAAGTRHFVDTYAVVPTVLVIDRGYAWADVAFDTSTVRFVTTHLESLWDAGEVPHGALQARQLLDDLADTDLPLVLLGDLNSDPRDPRGPGVANPGLQPTASEECPAQVDEPTVRTALADCSAYWTLRQGGFDDAGPDPLDPTNHTWGSDALLAGPDARRIDDALAMGNPYGFTDRLDYVLVRGGITPIDARIVGNAWPDGAGTWACDGPEQVANSTAASDRLVAAGVAGQGAGVGRCLPTDHAGVVAELALPATGDARAPEPIRRWRSPIGVWGAVGLVLLALVVWRVRSRPRSR